MIFIEFYHQPGRRFAEHRLQPASRPCAGANAERQRLRSRIPSPVSITVTRKTREDGLRIARHDFAAKRVIEAVKSANGADGVAHDLFDIAGRRIVCSEHDARRIGNLEQRLQCEPRRRLGHVVVKAPEISRDTFRYLLAQPLDRRRGRSAGIAERAPRRPCAA